jgi:putative sigma-54 modulation protein
MKNFDVNGIQLKIQSPGTEINDALNDYIIGHIEKLGKIYGRIIKCEMVLSDEKSGIKKGSKAEVKLFLPGNVLFASGQEESFHVASKNVFADLEKQLRKFKEKIIEDR